MQDSTIDIRDLYQELIIDHGAHPRNFCPMSDSDCTGEGYNPLCGDQVSLFIKFKQHPHEQHIIEKITFQGKGCAISTASASMLTEVLQGKTCKEAIEFSKIFQSSLTEENTVAVEIELGKLNALLGVKTFPARVKCATLAWHALLSALKTTDLTHAHI